MKSRAFAFAEERFCHIAGRDNLSLVTLEHSYNLMCRAICVLQRCVYYDYVSTETRVDAAELREVFLLRVVAFSLHTC